MKMYVMMLLSATLMGCASSKPYFSSQGIKATVDSEDFLVEDSPAEPVTASTEIRPGFLLQLSSGLDPKLNTRVRVSYEGTVKLPYNVTLEAAGQTASALSQKLQESYRAYYKTQPDIRVQIADRKYYIEVRGLVQKPGVTLVDEREKIEDIIKKSGDLSLSGEARQIQIIRGQNTYYVDLEEYFQGRGMSRSPRWFGGEKVLFLKSSSSLGQEEQQVIEVLGDVRNPGGLTFKEGADLYHYIFKAGGTTPTSDWDRVRVFRKTADGREVAYGPSQELAQNIKLQAGDTIVVGSATPGRFERNIQLGSLIGTILSAIGILIIAL